MVELLNQLLQNPLNSVFVVLSIVLLECLLSVDNAAVLATMVLDLPEKQRKKALQYGIAGAFIFRGVALFLASYVIEFWFLKPIGGAYLVYLCYKFFKDKKSVEQEVEESKHDKGNVLSKVLGVVTGFVGVFWSTVILVEIMDIAFSIDNIFAVVAFSNNMLLIVFGVCVGILAMRFIAQRFVKLIEKYKALESSAFIVIGILGFKLLLALPVHFFPQLHFLETETFDFIMSGLTVVVFIAPIVYGKFFKKVK